MTNFRFGSNTLSKDQKIRVIFRRSKKYAWSRIKAICLQNNVTEIYFIMDRSNLYFSFYSLSMDASDIHRFSNMK